MAFIICPNPEGVGFNATGGADLLEEQEQVGKEREDQSPFSNSLIKATSRSCGLYQKWIFLPQNICTKSLFPIPNVQIISEFSNFK